MSEPYYRHTLYEPRFRLYDDEPADPHSGLAERVLRAGTLKVQSAPTVGDFVEPMWAPESHYCRADQRGR